MILIGVPLKGGMRIKGILSNVNRIASARSGGIFRFGILFQGRGKGGKIKGQMAKG